MKRGFIVGILFVLALLFLGGIAFAGPKQCPSGQRDNCDYYRKKNNPNQYGCFPENANLGQGWIFVSDDCPDKKKEEEKPTNTAKPLPTNTVLPEIDPTEIPENIVDPKDGKQPKTTQEVLQVDTIEEWLACPTDCVCELLEKAVTLQAIDVRLKITEISIEETRNAILGGEE